MNRSGLPPLDEDGSESGSDEDGDSDDEDSNSELLNHVEAGSLTAIFCI